jgi:hypothetical protein
MKKTIIAGIVLGLSLTSVFASIDVNLKYGQKNDSVAELQDFLADKGLLTSSPTGFFGLLTLKAVKAYQVSQNLPVTGFVGPMTRAIINKELDAVVADSTAAEVAETGTSTPVNTGSVPNTVYVPVYIPTQTSFTPIPVVTPETYNIGTDGSSYSYAWWMGSYTLFVGGWVEDSHKTKVNTHPAICTSPTGEKKNATFTRAFGGGYEFKCEFEGQEKGIFTYTLSVPDLNLTKTLAVTIN